VCCQGDVLQFTSGIPILDEHGEAAELGEYDFWLVVGVNGA
jgi:hypothetical protein